MTYHGDVWFIFKGFGTKLKYKSFGTLNLVLKFLFIYLFIYFFLGGGGVGGGNKPYPRIK